MAPIRRGDGTGLDPQGYTEVRRGDGTVLWSAIPDSDLTQIADHIWYMDEGSGSTIADSEGSLDGSLGGPTWVTGDGGAGDSYLEFDGTDDVVDHANLIDDTAPSLTASFWAKLPDTGDAYICQQGSGESDGRFILWEINPTEVELNYSGIAAGKDSVATGEWKLFTGVFDADNDEVQIWVDDTLEGAESGSPDTGFSADDDFTIGNGKAIDRLWGDAIDYGVIAVGTAASESEISDHYEQTKSLYE